MIKRFVNRSKDYALLIPGQEQKKIDALKGKVSCLLYHRIEDYGKFEFLDRGGSPVTSPDDFEQEIEYLKSLPAKFYTLEQLQTDEFPDSQTIGVVICFDDCFKCNYNQGFEVLERYSIPAVFFQCTGFIDQTDLIWEHALYWFFYHDQYKQNFLAKIDHHVKHLDISKDNLLSQLREHANPKIIEQVITELVAELSLKPTIRKLAQSIYPDSKQIQRAANLRYEIASHGHHHYKRENVSTEDFEQELISSQSIIKELINKKPCSFSYPFNSYLSSDHELVNRYFANIATVDQKRLVESFKPDMQVVPRLTWPGQSNNRFRMKRWLLTGSF